MFTTQVTDADIRCAECGLSHQDVIDYADYWAEQGDRPMNPICCEVATEPDYKDDSWDEPDHDDTVHCCPDCELPNQFGELCHSCASERGEQPYA